MQQSTAKESVLLRQQMKPQHKERKIASNNQPGRTEDLQK
jgi:hypothetical protein